MIFAAYLEREKSDKTPVSNTKSRVENCYNCSGTTVILVVLFECKNYNSVDVIIALIGYLH